MSNEKRSKDFDAEVQKLAGSWKSDELKPMVDALTRLSTADVSRLASTPIPDIRTLSQEGLKISLARAEMRRRSIPFSQPQDGDSQNIR